MTFFVGRREFITLLGGVAAHGARAGANVGSRVPRQQIQLTTLRLLLWPHSTEV